MDDGVAVDTSGNYLTTTYITRVEAGGGAAVDSVAINNFVNAGIDSVSLWFGNSYGLTKDANNKITKYFDISDNDFDLAQSDTSKSAIYTPDALNGYASAVYDGSADFYYKGEVLGSVLFTPNIITITFVIKQDGTAANNGLFSSVHTAASNAVGLWCTYADAIYFDYGNESSGGRLIVAQPTGWDNAYHIIQFVRNGTAGEIWVDGTRILNTTFSDDFDDTITSNAVTPAIGARAGTFFKGEIIEGGITKGSQDAETIRNFLNTKYAVY